MTRLPIQISGLGLALCALAFTPASAAWEPTRPVEIIVPAGTGGGADQMARTVQGIITKHQLMKQPIVVVTSAGGAGGEGFLDLKGSAGNPHKLVITLSNLFTTPLGTGIPFSHKDLTPVAMMALDEFILWVNAESPYKSVKDYIAAVKAKPGEFKMGGTGSKQEDQIVTVAIEKATGTTSPTSRIAAAARWRSNWSASTSTPPSTIRLRPLHNGAVEPSGRFAFLTTSRCPTKMSSMTASRGTIFRHASPKGLMSST